MMDPNMMFWSGINFLILLLPFAFVIWVLSTLSGMRKELKAIRATLKDIAGRLDKGEGK